MSSKNHTNGQKSRSSRNIIADALRQRIVSGELKPGDQLPTRAELERLFEASPVTVQHSIDRLRAEGFVEPRGWEGTFVAIHPPHRYHYAMVITQPPTQGGWPRLFRALTNAATRYSDSDTEPRHLSVHTGVEDHLDNREMRHLVSAIRSRSLAGLIFPEHPGHTKLAFSALCQDHEIPCVAFLDQPFEGIGAVAFEPFESLALDYLAACGRKQVAVISISRPSTYWATMVKEMNARGMSTRPYWLQMVDLNGPACARNVTHLLLNPDQARRPDALFVTDDNLVEHCIAGIVDAGVRVPDELEVVTHCNFPWEVPSVLPVKRLGYDARTILAACLDVLEEERLTHQPVLRTAKAVFEEDLEN